MSIPLYPRRTRDGILIRAIQTSIQRVKFPVSAGEPLFTRSGMVSNAIEFLKFLFFQQASDGGLETVDCVHVSAEVPVQPGKIGLAEVARIGTRFLICRHDKWAHPNQSQRKDPGL